MHFTTYPGSGHSYTIPLPLETSALHPSTPANRSPVHSKNTQPTRGWNAADICANCVYTILAPPQRWGPDSVFWTSRPSLPGVWLAPHEVF